MTARRKTEVLTVGAASPADPAIAKAAKVLAQGGLVVFPTETVYGLGARASDASAVEKIFEAKGRPANVPLIVHVTGVEQARRYTPHFPQEAESLAQRFWPGPLSFVLERERHVPDAVTASGPTVAMRAPAHPVALALIEALGEGIAAPSANRFNQLPPVRGRHALKELDGRVDVILEAGLCPGGLESTVLDLTQSPARVLRRGAVPVEQLRALLAVQDAAAAVQAKRIADSTEEKSRGSWLFGGSYEQFEAVTAGLVGTVGAIVWSEQGRDAAQAQGWRVWQLGPGAERYAAGLYDVLHDCQQQRCVRVWVEPFAREPSWESVGDRVERLEATLTAP